MRLLALWICAILVGGGLNLPAPADATDGGIVFGDVISDLRDNNMSAESIRALDRFDRIEVVDVSGFTKGSEIQILQDTLRKTEDGFGEVQTAIAANERLEVEVERRSVSLRSVFAVTKSEDGVVTIYFGAAGLVFSYLRTPNQPQGASEIFNV